MQLKKSLGYNLEISKSFVPLHYFYKQEHIYLKNKDKNNLMKTTTTYTGKQYPQGKQGRVGLGMCMSFEEEWR